MMAHTTNYIPCIAFVLFVPVTLLFNDKSAIIVPPILFQSRNTTNFMPAQTKLKKMSNHREQIQRTDQSRKRLKNDIKQNKNRKACYCCNKTMSKLVKTRTLADNSNNRETINKTGMQGLCHNHHIQSYSILFKSSEKFNMDKLNKKSFIGGFY